MEVVTVGVRELKAGLSSYLSKVRAGHEVVVTHRGRPIARLTAVDPGLDTLTRLVSAGLVRPPTAPRVLPTRRITLSGPGTVEDLVADQRR